MSFTYDQFKTPFYDVKVGDPSGQRMVALPEQLRKLLEKVEILETNNMGNDCLVAQQIILNFIEGSREPFSTQGNPPTNELYPLGLNASDKLTNKPGLIPDLAFTHVGGNIGITSLEEAVGGGAVVTAALRDAAGTAEKLQSGKIDDSSVASPNDPIHYLFQEGNQVSVTWGWLQGEGLQGMTINGNSLPIQRTIRGRIQLIETDFSENGATKTTITCLCSTVDADKIAPTKGFNFAQQIPYGFDPLTGNVTVVHVDKDVNTVIDELVGQTGVHVAIGNKPFIADKIQKHNSRIWVGGESFHQFMLREAARMSAYYTIVLHPQTGEDTLIFIAKEEIDNIPLFNDKNLFTYKAPNSVLRSVKIKVDFSQPTGNARVGVDANGELTGASTNNAQTVEVFAPGSKRVDNIPKSEVMQKLQDVASKSGGPTAAPVAKTEYHPEADDKNKMKDMTKSTASCQNKHLVYLEFSSIGYPKLTAPGTVYFGGIGVRYSGYYRVLTVTHILDANSYVCRGSANSQTLSGQAGVQPDGNTPIEDKDKKIQVDMFESAQLSPSQVTGQIASSLGVADDGRKKYYDIIYS